MVLLSRMEAYQQQQCGLLMKAEPMGFRRWEDGGAEGQWWDARAPPSLGFALPAAGIVNQNSGDFSGSPGASYSSGNSYDCNSTGNVDSAEDASLSYLLDGNVRAMLKKVTVNEGVLNQTIQSLGGGEKGLRELMGYIMLWVKEHNGESSDSFSSQSLKNLRPPPSAFGYGAGITSGAFNLSLGSDRVNCSSDAPDVALDPNQFYQRAKSRRLMDDGEVNSSRATFVDVRGSIPDEYHFPKPEVGMLSGMPQQPAPPALQHNLSFASGHHDGALAATSRAARRNRIARQRQSLQQSQARSPSTAPSASSGCGLWSIPPPALSAGMFRPGAQHPTGVPASSGRKACNLDMLTFLLQKELRPSDVGNLGRIILPKKEAEMHLPILALREGVSLPMEDFDTGYCWTIRYRFWPNNKSRMYLLENTGEFVKSHHLEEGDLLILYRNQQGNYVLRGKKKVHLESRGAQGLQEKNAHSLARGFPEAPSNTVERDYEVKAELPVLVGDDDPFFKEDVLHNIDSSFGAGLIQPLERFPSLHIDFPLEEIMAGIPKDDEADDSDAKMAVVPKTEPAG